MRVIHLMKGTDQIYGAERVVLAELIWLRKKGIDARFMVLEETREPETMHLLGDAAAKLDVPVVRIPVDKPFSWRIVKGVREALRAEQADIVHCHSYKGDFIGLPACRLAKVPIVGEISGWLFPKNDVQIRFYEWLDVQALKQMDRAIVLADHYQRMCQRMGFQRERVRMIPSGVDIESLDAQVGQADLRARLGLTDGRPVVGMLTRLSHEKGVDIFLDALAFVVRRHSDVAAVIFGTGPEQARLEAHAARLGVTENVIWAGYTREAMDALRACDVVAQTSRTEALPQTLMEAMVMARPVVVTPVGGCPDLVRDQITGFVADGCDPEAIASRISFLLTRPERAREMGQAGRERILSHYTMDHWAERTIRLYREVVRA